MPITPLNIKPYFDDFDDDKNFVHVLFRPGTPIQARELTTLQSIMKDQIEKFGDHFFKNGSNVLDGGINVGSVDVLNISSFDLQYEIEYSVSDGAGNTTTLKTSTATNIDIQSLEGLTITGRDTGIEAKVLKVIDNSQTIPISEDPIKVIVSYTKTGEITDELATREGMDSSPVSVDGIEYASGTEISRFLFSEQIQAFRDKNVGLISRDYGVVFENMVLGNMAYSLAGTYYVSGNFVKTDKQSILLSTSNYDYGDNRVNEPPLNYKVGYTVNSSIITSSEDQSLLDNAEQATSYGTRGADRLKIELSLDKRDIDSTENPVNEDQNFIELVRYVEGDLAKDISNEAQYSAITEMLARRTYDESGDYFLNPFKLEFLEEASTENNFTASLGPSKAYVRGYEVEKLISTHIEVPRARSFEEIKKLEVDIEVGNSIDIRISGGTNPQDINAVDFGTNRQLELRGNSNADPLGVARLVSIGNSDNSIGIGEVKPFFKLTVSSGTNFTIGELVFTTTGQGYLAKKATNDLYLINVSGNIQNGQSLNTQDKANASNITVAPSELDISGTDTIRVVDGGTDMEVVSGAIFSGKSANLVYTSGRSVKTYKDSNSLIDNSFNYYAPQSPNDYYSLLDTANDVTPTSFEYRTNVITLDSKSETLGVPQIFTLSIDSGDIVSAPAAGRTGLILKVQLTANGVYSIAGVDNSGAGFASGDVLTIDGANVGGASGPNPDNDITITLTGSFIGPGIDITDLDGTTANATVATTSLVVLDDDLTNAYGFRADDLEIALEVNTNKVFTVLESTEEGLPPRGNQLLLDAPANPTIGFKSAYKIVGERSGTEAIVYRSNAIGGVSNYLNSHLNNQGTTFPTEYEYSDVTGSEDIVELVKLNGPGFESGEIVYQEYRAQTGAPIQRIERVVSSSANYYVETTANDITSKFIVDTGRRKTIIDLGRLRYKPFEIRANRKIGILLSYFHTNSTDVSYYSNADSYPLYEDIKVNHHETYDPSNFEDEYLVPELRDFVDFRKIRNFDHVDYRDNTAATTDDDNPFYFGSKVYFEQTPLAVDNTSFVATTSVYKARKDKIYLSSEGEFINVKGAPAYEPKEPLPIDDAMLLYDIDIPAYTRTTDSIKIEATDNRRYTMRDIGQIEKNVTQLQEVVSLNSLELAALSEFIPDATTPTVNRLKLGFIANPFIDESKTEIENPDNTCVIDISDNVLKPSQVQESINLIEGSDSAGEKGVGYVINDGMVTIEYDSVPYISQLKASDTIKINPYDAWSWIGTLSISPSRDFWRTYNINTKYVVINNSSGKVSFTSSPSRFSKWLKPTSTRRRRTIRNWRGLGRRWMASVEDRVTERTTAIRNNSTTIISSKDKMRGKNISFKAEMLRPNTKLIAKFDDKDVTQYCKQYIDNNTSGDLKAKAGDLKTDFLGNINGIFSLPDNEFETGKKVFWIGSDESQKDFTYGEAFYESSGQQINIDRTITATRNRFVNRKTVRGWKDPIAQSFLMENDGFLDSVDFWSAIVEGTERYKKEEELLESISQYNIISAIETYKIDNPGTGPDETLEIPSIVANLKNIISNGGGQTPANNFGNVLSGLIDDNGASDTSWYTSNDSIDKQLFPSPASFVTFFESVIQETVSDGPFVSLEIVTCDNGYPSQNTVPGSFVRLYPGDLTKFGRKNNKLYSSNNASIKSTAKFDYPIYLRANTEYAIVLKSPSGRNTVYISTLGERTIDTDEYISSQPYLGSLFTSQNASTWTPEQTKDLKFEIKRCKFKSNATLRVVNELIEDYRPIGNNENGISLETVAGSNYITVYHPNHCMFNTSGLGYTSGNNVSIHSFKILNTPDTSNGTISGGEFNGIPLSEINNVSLTVFSFTNDTYTFEVTTNANKSGFGGASVIASQATQFNEADLMSNVIQPQGTQLEAGLIPKVYGSSIANRNTSTSNLDEDGPAFIDLSLTNNTYKRLIPMNESFELEQPIIITSKNLNNNTSVLIDLDLSTDNDFLSPVIDLQDLELLTIRNVIDYIDNSDDGTEALSKHVSIPVALNNPGKGLKFTFDYEMSKFSKIGVYYKAIPKGSDLPFDELDWVFGDYIINPNENVAELTINDIPEFDEFKIMLTLNSWSEAKYPIVKNLRVIATAS